MYGPCSEERLRLGAAQQKKVQNANKRGGKRSIGSQESRHLVAAMHCCKE